MKFDDIRHAHEAKTKGAETKATSYTETWPVFSGEVMNALMHVLAFHRQPVFLPGMLNVDQGALPFTEEHVLKRGKRKQFVFRIHQTFNRFFASFSRK